MKVIKYLFLVALMAAVAVSCEEGLDPINAVGPGTEQFSPELSITFPTEGKIVRSSDSVATVVFKFLASDDFELGSVVLSLDGAEIGNVTQFTDYRRWDANFSYSGLRDGEHTLLITVTDLSGKSVSDTVNFLKITTAVYVPLDGEVYYFPFDGDYKDAIAEAEMALVGTPDFINEGKVNLAYQGAAESYMTLPTTEITSGDGFGVAFWYKLNPEPGRAGIISISRDIAENRPWGFRMFREPSGTQMAFGVNFGIGTTEVWMNPFIKITPDDQWIHFAVSIGPASATIYVNGEVAMENLETGGPLDWTECSSMSVASGQPNFTYWDHNADLSNYDEMHFFKRAITAEEVQAFAAAKK